MCHWYLSGYFSPVILAVFPVKVPAIAGNNTGIFAVFACFSGKSSGYSRKNYRKF